MKIKALVTMLVLGTSSVAMARPATVAGSAGGTVTASAQWSFSTASNRGNDRVRDHRDQDRVVIRDHRTPRTPAPTPVAYQPRPNYIITSPRPYYEAPRFTVLGQGLVFSANDYRKDLGLDGSKLFSTVRIDAAGSAVNIQEVRVTFKTGETQTIAVNQTISGNQTLTYDLTGELRPVTRVLVYGAPTADRYAPRTSAGFAVMLK